jgi:predicted CXXCH cytochrome family protein
VNCGACHTANGEQHPKENVNGFTLADTLPGLCLNCHTELETLKHSHPPFTIGKCTICHSPHSSPNKSILKEEMPTLCFNCHDVQAEEATMANQHPPFGKSCMICHNGHSSDQPRLQKQSTTELCLGCHDDVQAAIDESPFQHSPVKDSISCVNCHSPHASANKKLMLAEQKDVCLKCHNKPITEGNRTIANIQAVLQNAKSVHPPVVQGGCSSCHSAHGGKLPKLLKDKYPDTYYTNSVADTFALCWGCHDVDLLEASTTTTATNFRNGDKNLHSLHLKEQKNRSCNFCHDVHAAKNEHLIIDKVPFGNWTMKMNYKADSTGGSCGPGCHGVKSYKRD